MRCKGECSGLHRTVEEIQAEKNEARLRLGRHMKSQSASTAWCPSQNVESVGGPDGDAGCRLSPRLEYLSPPEKQQLPEVPTEPPAGLNLHLRCGWVPGEDHREPWIFPASVSLPFFRSRLLPLLLGHTHLPLGGIRAGVCICPRTNTQLLACVQPTQELGETLNFLSTCSLVFLPTEETSLDVYGRPYPIRALHNGLEICFLLEPTQINTHELGSLNSAAKDRGLFPPKHVEPTLEQIKTFHLLAVGITTLITFIVQALYFFHRRHPSTECVHISPPALLPTFLALFLDST